MTQNLVRRDGVLFRQMEDECLLYDGDKSKVHVLNEVAGFVWEMCDGENTARDIEQRVREVFDVPGHTRLTEDIQDCLATLTKLDLLVPLEDATSA